MFKSEHNAYDHRRWWALLVLLAATFMALLDSFIVTVAIPSIESDLHATNAEIQFVLAGYTLSYAVLLIIGSRLGDIFGRKRIFLFGLASFVVTSAFCGAASSALLLIMFRIIQGIAAATMMPQVLAIVQVSFRPEERPRALSLYGATIGVATVSGQLIGGVLISQDAFHLGWRSVFYVNLPIGIVALLAGLLLLKDSRNALTNQLDLGGAVLLSVGLLALSVPLVQGREAGWPIWSICLLVSTPIWLILFMTYERRYLARGRSPLLPPGIFHDWTFTIGLSLALIFYAIASALFFTLAIMLQQGFQYSALISGMTYFPLGIAFFAASLLSAKLVRRIGPLTLLWGSVFTLIGIIYTMRIVANRGALLAWHQLWPSLFITGIGLGTCAAPLIGIILSRVKPIHAGSAAGLLATTTQISTALGVCFVGIFFFQALPPTKSDLNLHLAYAHAFVIALQFVLALSIAYTALLLFLNRKIFGQIRRAFTP